MMNRSRSAGEPCNYCCGRERVFDSCGCSCSVSLLFVVKNASYKRSRTNSENVDLHPAVEVIVRPASSS